MIVCGKKIVGKNRGSTNNNNNSSNNSSNSTRSAFVVLNSVEDIFREPLYDSSLILVAYLTLRRKEKARSYKPLFGTNLKPSKIVLMSRIISNWNNLLL